MNNFGFVRVAAAIPEVKVADCSFNSKKIEELIFKAREEEVQIVCFPELSITAYTCGDLFFQHLLIQQAEKEIGRLLDATRDSGIVFITGAPVRAGDKLFNTAIICQAGNILGIVPKTYLPNYKEFYEQRWFVSSFEKDASLDEIEYAGNRVPFGTDILFTHKTFAFAVEICEDLWAPEPPSSLHAVNGAHIIFNLSATNELIGKNDYLRLLLRQQSARCLAGYVYASCGNGESTTDVVFAGNGIICENGNILSASKRFLFEPQLVINEIDVQKLQSDRMQTTSFREGINDGKEYSRRYIELPLITSFDLHRTIDPHPFVPSKSDYNERCEEIFSIQVGGLAKRMVHTNAKTAVIGISGGLDSTLALLVIVKTFDKLGLSRQNILGITMPGYGTTDRTYQNALKLMEYLGITSREINIKAACEQHFKDIGHDPGNHDVVFENTQARERTQILMDISNQQNGLVIGTGDLSELALGWATYNGDQMSMYGVNASIPKTLVKYLIQWVSETQVDEKSAYILEDVINTPISPELLPPGEAGDIKQKTEDIVGPYELHDFYLYYMMRFGFSPAKIYYLAKKGFNGKYEDSFILKWMETFYRRFFNQQFKRSAMPDGPKVGSVNLSPRGDWRMPSDASSHIWLQEIETLKKENG